MGCSASVSVPQSSESHDSKNGRKDHVFAPIGPELSTLRRHSAGELPLRHGAGIAVGDGSEKSATRPKDRSLSVVSIEEVQNSSHSWAVRRTLKTPPSDFGHIEVVAAAALSPSLFLLSLESSSSSSSFPIISQSKKFR